MSVRRPHRGKEYVALGSYIPRDIDVLVKAAAKREGKTQQQIIEEGLRERVAPKPAGTKST